jgi:hypothetical protein
MARPSGTATRRGPGIGSLLSGLLLLMGTLALRRVIGALSGSRSRTRAVTREAVRAGHETSDLNVGAVVAAGVGLVLVLALVLVGVTWLEGGVRGPLGAPGLPPEPRLEAVPGQQLRDVRASWDALLHSYGWVDRQAGVARIPIERAMDLLAERGLPASPEPGDGTRGAPTDASSGRMTDGRP